MKNIEKKKIPFVLLIGSLLFNIVSYVNGEEIIIYKKYAPSQIKSSYIDHQIPIFPTIILGLSIYLVLFKTDSEIKEFFKKIKDKIFSYFPNNNISTIWRIILSLILLIIILLVGAQCNRNGALNKTNNRNEIYTNRSVISNEPEDELIDTASVNK